LAEKCREKSKKYQKGGSTPGLPNPNLQNQEFFEKKQGVDQEILA
jgi:hypothetical protein